NPEYRDAFTNRGVVYADMGDLDSAVSDFDMAIELDSEFWFAYSQRGLALWALGRREEAEADYARLRELQS
ncbi:MAG: tetratricopeptide repeat protein, partial [Dehalococcoidia bacterium]|nr:tetratricopeptide repeat protein [Dehalococcoidia bacterium]